MKKKLKKAINLNPKEEGIIKGNDFSNRIYPKDSTAHINGGPSLCYMAVVTIFYDEWNCPFNGDDGYDYVCDWFGKGRSSLENMC